MVKRHNIPLSLYIHLPWCIKKCPYCDFNSHAKTVSKTDESSYIEALLKDIQFEAFRIKDREINTIFIGGGTPSLFSVKSLSRLIIELKKILNISNSPEITLEANPGSAEAENFAGYFEQGVNRLSIGVQSFDDNNLSRLGRVHDSNQAIKAIEAAQEAGFSNFNIDLMYGLPGQTLHQALDDLNRAITLQPTHISWYELTIEPNTFFYSHQPQLPHEDAVWQMHIEGKSLLENKSYMQYEVSAYGKKQCLHNLNYWRFGDYMGIGAGAHGKITNPETGAIERFSRTKIPDTYIKKAGNQNVITNVQRVTSADLAFEFMLNAFRLTNGFDLDLFTERTALPLEMITKKLELAKSQRFLNIENSIVQPTVKGTQYLNDLIEIFLP